MRSGKSKARRQRKEEGWGGIGVKDPINKSRTTSGVRRKKKGSKGTEEGDDNGKARQGPSKRRTKGTSNDVPVGTAYREKGKTWGGTWGDHSSKYPRNG